MTDTSISPARRWAITLSVMMVTVMQVLDTSVTNVALPHMQGSMSAGIEEMTWGVTSYLAANPVAIPAPGWLSARIGRRPYGVPSERGRSRSEGVLDQAAAGLSTWSMM